MSEGYYRAYIGANSLRGALGEYTVDIDEDSLEARIVSATRVFNAGCCDLSRDGKVLYTANEGMTFEGYADGGICAFRIGDDGSLTRIGAERSYGQRTCCVSIDEAGENVYCCNFYHGTWSAFPLDIEGNIGPARLVVQPPKVEPKVRLGNHCIVPIGNDCVGVISLTECAIVIYRADDGTKISKYEFPEGSFPRYIASRGHYVYVLMQWPGLIYVFEEQDGVLDLIQMQDLYCGYYDGMARTSVIRITPDGGLVLAGDRATDTIGVFTRNPDGTLTYENTVKVSGEILRDFNISRDGNIVVAAMQESDEIRILRIDYENKTLLPAGEKLTVPSPAAVAVTGRLLYG